MFKHKKENYKIIIKDLNKDFPNCDVKLAGKYLKIFTTSSDEHRIVTEHLDEKREEFYVINPPDSSPQKLSPKDSRFPLKSDTWLTGASAKNSPEKKKVKRLPIATLSKKQIKKPFKPVTPNLSFAATLSGAPNKNKTPGTSAATEEAPRSHENNSNDNYFGFNDAIIELRRFFLDYPFLLEMGRQFRNAKDEERIDIFYQNLINSYDRKA
ncbi:hypothetical protein TNCV_226181 [Trichonephila clavipes]|nr:hypothetical protein TNCV_226181 [Trichonephila clavipes]